MSRLFMTGFEMGAIPMTVSQTNYVPDVITTTARTGTYALRIDRSEEGVYANGGKTVTEMYARVALYPTSASYGSNLRGIITFRNSAGNSILSLACGIGDLTLRMLSATLTSWSTLAAGMTLSLNTWYLLEVRVIPADTNGICQVKVNGELTIDYTGDTLGYYTTANLHDVILGNTASVPGISGLMGYYDDFAINDTSGDHNNSWCGRGGIEALKPTGAGTTTQLTPSTGDNWNCVDEVPPSDADYVSSGTADKYDTYALSNTTLSGGVTAACVWMRGALAEAGSGNLAAVIRSAGADYTGDDKGLDTLYSYVRQIYETNPATGALWTTSELDGIEAGPKVR